MKKLVIYYSYSGNTKAIAQELAAKESADIAEIKDKKRPGKIKAYTAGIVSSILGKAWKIQPLTVDLAVYDHLIMLAPVWAGNPAPAFNSVFEKLPEGKVITLKMVSMSGKSDCKARLESKIKAKNCALENFEDIKV